MEQEYFSNKCAYCGKTSEVVDHAIPINRDQLGEHRLGNLIPCCKECNGKKSDKGYRQYLDLLLHDSQITEKEKLERQDKIEKYMWLCNYDPIVDKKISDLLNEIYDKTYQLAEEYVSKVNNMYYNNVDLQKILDACEIDEEWENSSEYPRKSLQDILNSL